MMENNEEKNVFDSKIGKDKDNSKKVKITIGIIVVLIIALAVGYYIYRKSSVTEIAIGLSDIELTEELKSNMVSIAQKADQYLVDNRGDKVLTSQYGLLYSYKDKSNVIVSEILDNSGIANNILAEMDVLYVKPMDVLSDNTDDNLSIFISVNSSSGYYVVNGNNENNLFTEEEFRNMLMKYAPTHGSIVNPKRGEENHTAIISAANLADADIDIKHIACDDKYAVVVGGSISNPADIKEVALVNDNGWSVINGDLASVPVSYITINESYPDMDLGIMPIYNLADFDEIDSVDMTKIIESLVELNMLTEDDKEGIYACGCGRFAYVQTEDGKRLVGYMNDDRQLEFNEADSIEEVISIMVQCQENPPVFIAKFE